MHRYGGIITINLSEMHCYGKISSSLKHGKPEKWSSVYPVGVTGLLGLRQQRNNAPRNACLSPMTSLCVFGQKGSNELWKKILVYSVRCHIPCLIPMSLLC